MFPLCGDAGIGFTAFSPLAGGWLTGKYERDGSYPAGSRMTLRPEPYHHLESPGVFDALEILDREAKARGAAMSSVAMAWALRQPRVDVLIIGPRKPGHIDEALSSLEVELDGEAASRLSAAFPPA